MNEFDDELRDLLRANRETPPPPAFNTMWQKASRLASTGRRRTVRRAIAVAAAAAAAMAAAGIISFLPDDGAAGPDSSPHSFCSKEAVDDWLIMMSSDFFRELPSDHLLSSSL